jgi:hypothetical protein
MSDLLHNFRSIFICFLALLIKCHRGTSYFMIEFRLFPLLFYFPSIMLDPTASLGAVFYFSRSEDSRGQSVLVCTSLHIAAVYDSCSLFFTAIHRVMSIVI